MSTGNHQVFPVSVLRDGELTCPQCAWQGKAAATAQEHLFLTDAIELFCPRCAAYLGFVNDEDPNTRE